MERHDAQLSLAMSRARLRSLLLPDPDTGRIEADVFPRSGVMKALLFALPVIGAAATRSPLMQALIREVGSRLR
jgi:hypothetical protein